VPTLSASSLNQFSRVSKYVARATTRFSVTKRDEGSIIALRGIWADLRRSTALRLVASWRRVRNFKDLLTLLPLRRRFKQRGVLFVGYLEAGLGLGESLRGLVRSIETTDQTFALYPFNIGVESRFIGRFLDGRYDLRRRYQVNVIEMATDQVPLLFREIGRWKVAHSYNILRTYWELPQAPFEWAAAVKGIQEMWVPNRFVEKAFRGIFDGPINIIPPCVEVSIGEAFDRGRFGMEEGRFYFVFSFDYHSHPTRKNPIGVVSAFQSAFPNRSENVGLVIKSTGVPDRYSEIRARILDAADHDPRIKIIDSMFSRDEMLSLINQADCYVSLHRSEGFGLGMAEAMALGKPVIATDYSGNTDFLSERTGFPVSFTLRPVQDGEYVFSDGQSWAEPDVVSAAEAMLRVFRDPAEREVRAASGKAFVEAHYGRISVGRIAARRLQDILATDP
jgi:glycosyltransferase involved in cell wall biosynthesis